MTFRPSVKSAVAVPAFLLILVFIFSWDPFSSYRKIAPDDKISVKGITAKIEHLESCWEGCSNHDEIKFIANYRILGEDFFRREIGLPWQPYTDGVIAFPKKAMLLTIFSSMNEGSVVSGITTAGGEPHIVALMGCIEVDNATFSPQPSVPGHHCDNFDGEIYWGHLANPTIFSHSLQISYHHKFWIDYKTQTFHEIATNAPENGKFIGVIGVDEERRHILVLFHIENKDSSSLCTYGNSGIKATYHCMEFLPAIPLPLQNLTKEPARIAQIPVATSGIEYVSYDNAPLNMWISQYFILSPKGSPFPIPRANTTIINFQNGVKPSPLKKWESGCGQCQR